MILSLFEDSDIKVRPGPTSQKRLESVRSRSNGEQLARNDAARALKAAKKFSRKGGEDIKKANDSALKGDAKSWKKHWNNAGKNAIKTSNKLSSANVSKAYSKIPSYQKAREDFSKNSKLLGAGAIVATGAHIHRKMMNGD